MEKAKQLLESLVRAMVRNEDAMAVDAKTNELGVLLTLNVAKEDMGIVIGRTGATANALRLLLKCVGIKEGARVSMKVAEPQGSDRGSDF